MFVHHHKVGTKLTHLFDHLAILRVYGTCLSYIYRFSAVVISRAGLEHNQAQDCCQITVS